ncbi:glutathione S-transferase family protein [Ancylobacter pratisalsi]|uniref:Glutathione S-transferase family protein n=1 Tax=Ancylobacter pratisalsi TaxID=1745854 RepID=A0A6P1YI02_9HYPH|nr:glutathione S-transferase family protein [Ancylobacter pratisalsi]QIB32336.1 glutathione S-transferase family protein [Ancylobacter pratisalsi]
MSLKLVIGNKNYSSWSLRPWLAMTAFHIPFEEIMVPLDTPEFKARVREHSPAGRVPVLIDGEAVVWESIAILEHLAERFPDKAIWPSAAAARAHARSVATEMHGGFGALRREAPMNLWRPVEPRAFPEDTLKDVRALQRRWNEARERFGAGGDFLYGAFSAADAMYAPVATRLRTYAIEVDAVCSAYVEAVHAHPAFIAWKEAALQETHIVEADEVDWPQVKRV